MKIIPRRSVNFPPGVFALLFNSALKKEVYSGPLVRNFTRNFADYIGRDHAVGASMARSAFFLLLSAMGLEEGDEIIMPAYNFHVLPLIAKFMGFKPVFVEVEKDTFNIDASLIEEKLTPRTKAILAIHMSGLPCEMDYISDIARKHGLLLIEDCAQALGAEYKGRKAGAWGDAAFYSFDFNKNMPCFLGGMIAADRNLCEKIYLLCEDYTAPDRGEFRRTIFTNSVFYLMMEKWSFWLCVYPFLRAADLAGRGDFFDKLTHSEITMPEKMPRYYRMKLNNLQAAVGSRQLERLDGVNSRMMANAEALNKELKGLEEVRAQASPPGRKHIRLYYRIVAERSDELRRYLLRKGVDSLKSCMLSCPDLGFFPEDNGRFPAAAEIAGNGMEIPNGPSLTESDMAYIGKKIKEFYRGKKGQDKGFLEG